MIDGFGADIKVGDLLVVVQKTKKNVSMKKEQNFATNPKKFSFHFEINFVLFCFKSVAIISITSCRFVFIRMTYLFICEN